MMWQLMTWKSLIDSWMSDIATRGNFLVSCTVPRGPVVGYHVAPYY
jgi:hypothetical protein